MKLLPPIPSCSNENFCFHVGDYSFGFNGKDKESEFNSGAYDFGARMLDSRIARFVSIDPLVNDYPWNGAYGYAENNPLYFIDKEGKNPEPAPVRLIFYGGAKKHKDNSAFHWAARNVNSTWGGKAKVLKARSSDYVSQQVNQQAENSIQSIDILCHGSQYALYMGYNEETQDAAPEEPIEGVTGYWDYSANPMYASSTVKGAQSWLNGWEEGTIYDIDYSKFMQNARIEIHGCKSAASTLMVDNLAENLSEALYSKGKINAVVIAHTEQANPKIEGDKTKVSGQDYRHGSRNVYHNGTILFTTKVKGHISDDVIQKYIKEKEACIANDQNYDGANKVYEKPKK